MAGCVTADKIKDQFQKELENVRQQTMSQFGVVVPNTCPPKYLPCPKEATDMSKYIPKEQCNKMVEDTKKQYGVYNSKSCPPRWEPCPKGQQPAQCPPPKCPEVKCPTPAPVKCPEPVKCAPCPSHKCPQPSQCAPCPPCKQASCPTLPAPQCPPSQAPRCTIAQESKKVQGMYASGVPSATDSVHEIYSSFI